MILVLESNFSRTYQISFQLYTIDVDHATIICIRKENTMSKMSNYAAERNSESEAVFGMEIENMLVSSMGVRGQ